MSAQILPFLRQAPVRALCAGGAIRGDFLRASAPPQPVEIAPKRTDFLVTGHHRFAPFTAEWCAQHLPLIDAAMDLLSADNVEFDRRCALIKDMDGRAMLDDLAGQLDRLGAHIADVADAIGLTAERIRDAMNSRPSVTS